MATLAERVEASIVRLGQRLNGGVTATLTEVADRVYDRATGSYTGGTSTSWEFITPPLAAPRRQRPGAEESTTSAGWITMPAMRRADDSIVVPQAGQTVTYLGVVYTIVAVKPIQVGGTYAGFRMEVRT